MSRKLWTKEEAEELINYYKTHSIDESIEQYGYASANSFRITISELHKRFGIPKERKLKWDEEKAKELVNFYATHTAEETAEKFGLSIYSVYSKVSRLSKKYNITRNRQVRWTEDNTKELIEYYDNHTAEETAEKFSLSANSVQSTVLRLSKKYNIARHGEQRFWTEDRAREFIEFYDNHTAEETAEKFGLSIYSVDSKVSRLSKKYNIARHYERRFWTEDNTKELIEYYDNHTAEETAEKFSLSANSVHPTVFRLSKKYNISRQKN